MKLNNKILSALANYPALKNNVIPAHDDIHFRNGKIFIVDINNQLVLNVPEVNEEFSLNFKDFKEVIGYLKKSPNVEIVISGEKVKICGTDKPKSVFTYPIKTLDLFECPVVEHEVLHTVSLVEKREVIKKTAEFVGDDELRPQLMHPFVSESYVAATNRHYLYIKKYENDDERGANFNINFIKFLPYATEMEVGETKTTIAINIEGYKGYIAYNFFGKFPSIFDIVPDYYFGGTVSFNGKELINDAKIFSKINDAVTMITITKEEIIFSAENIDLGKEYQNSYKLLINSGVSGSIALASKYLQTILANIETGIISFSVLTSDKLMRFNDAYIMPVILTEGKEEILIKGKKYTDHMTEMLIEQATAITELKKGRYDINYRVNRAGKSDMWKEFYYFDGEKAKRTFFMEHESRTEINLETKEVKFIEGKAEEEPTPEEQAIMNQMFDGPGSTNDEKAEMEMAIAADKSVQEKEDFPDAIAICPSCGVDAIKERVDQSDEKPHYFCQNCLSEFPKDLKKDIVMDKSIYHCPLCDSPMDLSTSDSGSVLYCFNCELIIPQKEFDKEETLYEASGLSKTEDPLYDADRFGNMIGKDEPTQEDEKMLQNINESATKETIKAVLNGGINYEEEILFLAAKYKKCCKEVLESGNDKAFQNLVEDERLFISASIFDRYKKNIEIFNADSLEYMTRLAEQAEKIHQKYFGFLSGMTDLNENSKPITEEIKTERRKQLLIGGFALKDGQFNLEDKIFRPESILDLSDELFAKEMEAIAAEKKAYYLEKSNMKRENASKPRELPRSICSVCGKYEWTSKMVDGKCQKCQTLEIKTPPPATKEESFKAAEHHEETKQQSIPSAEIVSSIQGDNEEIQVKTPETSTAEENGQIKMPWD